MVTHEEKPAAELMKILVDIPVISYIGCSEQITEKRARELGDKESILTPSFEQQAG